mgnify:CR=1 FL=1
MLGGIRMRARLEQFMYGRYGQDLLNRDLSIVALVICVVSMFVQWTWLYTLALAVLVYTIYRMFSKNIERRRMEAEGYLRLQNRVKLFFTRGRGRIEQSKTHRFYKCPSCGQKVRVPKGRGKISIDCPKCHNAFTKKT